MGKKSFSEGSVTFPLISKEGSLEEVAILYHPSFNEALYPRRIE
jgi:hypothetical protein